MTSSSVFFFLTIAITLLITLWFGRGKSKSSLYAAGSRIGATQNGLALAGDTLSASVILGVVGVFFTAGVDAAIFAVPTMAGFCLLLVFLVRPLRRMGKFTLGNVVASRFPGSKMRIVVGLCSASISFIYLIAQLVGAGALISTIFGLSYWVSVIAVAILVTGYVSFGGMLAATWVQIIKSTLLVAILIIMSILSIYRAGGISEIYTMQHTVSNVALFSFGGLKLDAFSIASIAASALLGIMGMPHVLIRFFTVPDENVAQRSMAIGTGIMGLVIALVLTVIAPSAVKLLTNRPEFWDASGVLIGGPNMVTLQLARYVGGDLLFGVMGAIVFATILAVVAGLMVAISSATAQDLSQSFGLKKLSESGELKVFRYAAVGSAAFAAIIAISLENQNVAFLTAVGAGLSASTTFPMLILTVYWRRLKETGVMAAGLAGLSASLLMIVIGPIFWVGVLRFKEPIFPSEFPALAATPVAFLAAWLFSTLFGGKGQSSAHGAQFP